MSLEQVIGAPIGHRAGHVCPNAGPRRLHARTPAFALAVAAVATLGGCVTTAADGSYQVQTIGQAIESSIDPHWSSLPELTPLRAALLFSRRESTPIDWEQATYYYPAVSGASNEFQKRDAIASVRPLLERVNAELDPAALFVVRAEMGLPAPYDFTQHRFVTNFEATTAIVRPPPYGSSAASITLTFDNSVQLHQLPMDEATARRLRSGPIGGQVLLELEVQAQTVRMESESRIVVLHIRRARVWAESFPGQPLGLPLVEVALDEGRTSSASAALNPNP